jgi:hypothetical protein
VAERLAIGSNPVVTRWVLFGLYSKLNVESPDMSLYVAEFEFRYNNRENADIFDAAIARC